MNYPETVHYLFTALPVFQHSGGSAYKPGLQTASELDDFYDNPHRKYKTIHVAGTNGKGSVSHMLAAVLQGAGYKTGLFTSPHLVDFRERIKINGSMISEQEVVDFVARSKNLFDKVQPSFFEMTSALALAHFALHKVDFAVIETGMGGRLDSTNIITPVLSIITNVSFDHTQFLGKTLVDIAIEKAGIIKPHVPVVIGETIAEVSGVFKTRAMEQGSPIVFADQEADIIQTEYTKTGQTIYLRQQEQATDLTVTIDLGGDYQQKNVLTVLSAIQYLANSKIIHISRDSILTSLMQAAQTTGLYGRWQQLRAHPFTVCDTAHNTAGLAYVVRQIQKCPYKNLRMVIGFVNDKDVAGLLQLLPETAVYYFTKASIPRALDEHQLMHQAKAYGLIGASYPEVIKALESAWHDADPEDMVFVGGSTFVVADVLKSLTI